MKLETRYTFCCIIGASSRIPNVYPNLTDHVNYTLLIGDWLHQTTLSKYVQHHHSSGNNKGESMLINGKGESEVWIIKRTGSFFQT